MKKTFPALTHDIQNGGLSSDQDGSESVNVAKIAVVEDWFRLWWFAIRRQNSGPQDRLTLIAVETNFSSSQGGK